MELGLRDKTVVVSGASGAIGEAICAAFLEEGAVVAPLFRGDPERISGLRELAGEDSFAERVVPLRADLTDDAQVERALDELLELRGGVDVLVNNAGITFERPFLATPEEEARRVVEVNLWGTARLTRLVLKPMMRARSGSVVTVTSVVARHGGRGVSMYAATKAALETLTRSLAIEMAPKGVRLNAVAPGVIETPMSHRLRRRRGETLKERIPLGRLGVPEDVAPAVLWLASDVASSYVTGQLFTIDGGLSL